MNVFKWTIAAAAFTVCCIGNPITAEASSSRCKPVGFGGQVCVTGNGQYQQYNNNPCRSSNYQKALDVPD